MKHLAIALVIITGIISCTYVEVVRGERTAEERRICLSSGKTPVSTLKEREWECR